jgi:hypothetical protein
MKEERRRQANWADWLLIKHLLFTFLSETISGLIE